MCLFISLISFSPASPSTCIKKKLLSLFLLQYFLLSFMKLYDSPGCSDVVKEPTGLEYLRKP